MNKDSFLKFLSAFEFSPSKIAKLLALAEDDFCLEEYACSPQVKEILGDEYQKLSAKFNQKFFDKYLARLEDKGIKLISCEDKNFPHKFDKMEDRPYYLFYKGNLSLADKKCVSIVGTRSPSNYGVVITERFSSSLAKAGAVIVSGLAYGVDSIAHRKALENGTTIAVLAGGFDKIYPAEHTSLFNEIASKGLVLSEHRPDVSALKYHFVQRNRIVAALADALLVTEAGAKSGTTITKDYALDYGVPIYAVPGNITSPKSEGTNALISTLQGICALDENGIIADLGLEAKKSKRLQLNMQEEQIVRAISSDGSAIDDIVEKTGFNISIINSLLTSLEIKGIIKKMPGGIITQG